MASSMLPWRRMIMPLLYHALSLSLSISMMASKHLRAVAISPALTAFSACWRSSASVGMISLFDRYGRSYFLTTLGTGPSAGGCSPPAGGWAGGFAAAPAVPPAFLNSTPHLGHSVAKEGIHASHSEHLTTSVSNS